MPLITRAVSPTWSTLFFLIAILSFAGARPVVALEEVIVSYAGPTVTFLPARGGTSAWVSARAEPRH